MNYNPTAHADYSELFRSLWPSVMHLDGDVAEFGVYNGGNCFALSRTTGRRVWAFDTFEGIPREDYSVVVDQDEPGKFKPEFDWQAAEPRLVEAGIIPVKGRFAETLPWFAGPFPRFAMVLVDVDLYQSSLQVFNFLQRHMVENGIIVIDDFRTHQGVRDAVFKAFRQFAIVEEKRNHLVIRL